MEPNIAIDMSVKILYLAHCVIRSIRNMLIQPDKQTNSNLSCSNFTFRRAESYTFQPYLTGIMGNEALKSCFQPPSFFSFLSLAVILFTATFCVVLFQSPIFSFHWQMCFFFFFFFPLAATAMREIRLNSRSRD